MQDPFSDALDLWEDEELLEQLELLAAQEDATQEDFGTADFDSFDDFETFLENPPPIPSNKATHLKDGHDVVRSQAANKYFWYCRDCKEEVNE